MMTVMKLVMKVIIVKEVMTCDVSPVAMFFYISPRERPARVGPQRRGFLQSLRPTHWRYLEHAERITRTLVRYGIRS